MDNQNINFQNGGNTGWYYSGTWWLAFCWRGRTILKIPRLLWR